MLEISISACEYFGDTFQLITVDRAGQGTVKNRKTEFLYSHRRKW
jgi:hypothetical protein